MSSSSPGYQKGLTPLHELPLQAGAVDARERTSEILLRNSLVFLN
ncbi:hypothetical protein SDC9_154735 [bioreactor metagenome]|uniref:Uncharacterized protein n=1 Tax=bioreactor metagenome TaxID=1076179 RepID=A0A645EZH8_9ZZZZ